MMNAGKDEIICDLAQTYGILNYRALQARLLATLVLGLPSDSRIAKKITGNKVDDKTLLLAMISDSLKILIWQRTEDGHNNRNKPQSLAAKLSGKVEEKEIIGFDTPEEFEKARMEIANGG